MPNKLKLKIVPIDFMGQDVLSGREFIKRATEASCGKSGAEFYEALLMDMTQLHLLGYETGFVVLVLPDAHFYLGATSFVRTFVCRDGVWRPSFHSIADDDMGNFTPSSMVLVPGRTKRLGALLSQ